jgi:hypothetical protein
LPQAASAGVRTPLKSYLEQRIILYLSDGAEALRQSDTRTAQLQGELWVVVPPPSRSDRRRPPPLSSRE